MKDTYKEHELHKRLDDNCSTCYSVKLERTKDWPRYTGQDLFKTNNGRGSNIPCGFNDEGEPSLSCNC